MIKHKRFVSTAVALVAMLATAGLSYGQGSADEDRSSGQATQTMDNEPNYGWVGLVGLLGLAGLMKKRENERPSDTRASAATR